MKLIIVTAFDRNEEGVLIPTYKPGPLETEEIAVELANTLAQKHAGVIAWVSPLGEEPNLQNAIVLFQRGEVPEME